MQIVQSHYSSRHRLKYSRKHREGHSYEVSRDSNQFKCSVIFVKLVALSAAGIRQINYML